MRRKSTRNSTKPQEKLKAQEQTPRKSRRTSRRRRKSTSSDSEKSEEEQETQVEVEEDKHSDNEENKSKSEENVEKEPTERKSRFSKDGKLRSEGDTKEADEEEEMPSRRLRRRETPKREDSEEDEGRTEKGKSKGKNKSKVENEPTHASGTFTESEICTNAQVTSQSPQTDITNTVTCESLVTQCAVDNIDDNRVAEDNNESSMLVDDNDKGVDMVDSSTSENVKINSIVNETDNDSRDAVIPPMSPTVETKSSAKSSDECDNSDIKKSKDHEDQESPKVSREHLSDDSSDTLTTKKISELEENQVQKEEAENIATVSEKDHKELDKRREDTKPKDENARKTEIEETPTEDEKSPRIVRSQSVEEEGSTRKQSTVNISEKVKETEKGHVIENLQEDPLKLRRPEDPKWKVLERRISTQKIKINRQSSETKEETKCKRRWGGGLKLVSSNIIDTSVMKNVYPNVQFLQESDVKLEYTETKTRRFSSAESTDDKSDRRVSIDFDRQTSEDSTKNDIEQDDKSNIIAVNRKISIIDDSATMLKPPPSPAKNPVSDVLFITNLVRPFTLKQLRELLERTGKIKEDGFWTDRIKSKCYVQYETEEQAKATREALHGVHWPIGNGKKLIIDYGTEEELVNAKNPPAPPPPPVVEVPKIEKENEDLHRMKKEERKSKEREERETRRREHVREWDVGKEELHHRSKSKSSHEHERRKHSRRSPSPPDEYLSKKKKKIEEHIPQKLMDDLFQKTKATPSIYWQPLTPDEIATKQQQRLERMAEHKKRLEETTRTRADYGRGAPYRRKYD